MWQLGGEGASHEDTGTQSNSCGWCKTYKPIGGHLAKEVIPTAGPFH